MGASECQGRPPPARASQGWPTTHKSACGSPTMGHIIAALEVFPKKGLLQGSLLRS